MIQKLAKDLKPGDRILRSGYPTAEVVSVERGIKTIQRAFIVATVRLPNGDVLHREYGEFYSVPVEPPLKGAST